MHRSLRSYRQMVLLACICLSLMQACGARKAPVHPNLTAAADSDDALAVSNALEDLIAAGEDTPADRVYAYEAVRKIDGDTAPALFARAAVTGRLVQQKGLAAADLIPTIERCARRSRELDPNFRDGDATRMLGTLYVMAPAALLRHGNSEIGLELLEGLVRSRPDVLENHLRLAEAYIALNDPAPAAPHLCRCLANEAALRPDDRKLLHQLVHGTSLPPCSTNGVEGNR